MDSRYLPTSAAQALYPELKCFLIDSVVKWPFIPWLDETFCRLNSCKCFKVNSKTSAFSNLVIDSPDSVWKYNRVCYDILLHISLISLLLIISEVETTFLLFQFTCKESMRRSLMSSKHLFILARRLRSNKGFITFLYWWVLDMGGSSICDGIVGTMFISVIFIWCFYNLGFIFWH